MTAEAFHKEAVKGVRVLIWVGIVGIVLGFVAVLNIDVSEKLAPYWAYVDKIEKGVFAKGRTSKGTSPIETGGTETRQPKELAPTPPPKPDGWVVDVFPERD